MSRIVIALLCVSAAAAVAAQRPTDHAFVPLVGATVNDKLRVAHTLDRDVNGRVGLWTKADSVTAFRNFTITH